MTKYSRRFTMQTILVVALAAIAQAVDVSEGRLAIILGHAEDSLSKKDYSSAIELSSLAINIDRNAMNAYVLRGKAKCLNGDYFEAISDFSHVLKREPKRFPKLYYLRADCVLALGYPELAVQDYSRCLSLIPLDGKVWYYRARNHAILGNLEKAMDDIEKGLATGTHHAKKLVELRDAITSGLDIPEHRACSN